MILLEAPRLVDAPLDQPVTDSVCCSMTISVIGCWQVHALAPASTMREIRRQLRAYATSAATPAGMAVTCWDLSRITSLDHIGAQMLWNCWGKRRPAQLVLLPQHAAFFNRLEAANQLVIPRQRSAHLNNVIQLGNVVLAFFSHALEFSVLLGQTVLDLGYLIRHPQRGPWKEISATIYHVGFRALGITALVGWLIGVVLSYLSGQQLRNLGGDSYLVTLLGISIVRELGPMLAAILVAGRSGSAITAQLGVMRVTEELDAMLVMGIPHGLRLILPKVVALAIAMPLLVMWTDAMALMGGMVSAQLILGISPGFFLQKLPDVISASTFYIGLSKGAVFGVLIALVACHFGLRIKPNTESLGQGTTTSVVSAITMVIVVDAIFAIVFSKTGFAG